MSWSEGPMDVWKNVTARQKIVGAAILIALLRWVFKLFSMPAESIGLPLVNQKKSDFRHNAQQLLVKGRNSFSGPFRVLTDSGPQTMFAPEMIDVINSNGQLSFGKYVAREFMAHFETFRVMRQPPEGMFEEAVIKGITRALPKYTKPLSLEMAAALDETWGNERQWKQVPLGTDVQRLMSRISTRIFLGDSFARNEEWNRIMTSYTANLFTAIFVTKAFHPVLRPIVDLISPLNRRCRRDYAEVASILNPVLEDRRKEIKLAQEEKRQPQLPDDSIEWFRSAAHGRDYEDVDLHLGLAIAAIHTSSDLVAQAILSLCVHADIIGALRREAVDVLSRHGVQKSALTELRLLDSVLKETQRLKPISMVSMHRTATADVTLPGTDLKILAGESLAISAERMWDPIIYPSPYKFDPYRYYNLRKTAGWENKAQLIATSPEHLGFSHGKHACPGRFFAENEVKVAMLHVLLKYDIRIEKPEDAVPETFGLSMCVRRGVKVWMKRRSAEEQEVDLEKLTREL